MKSSVAPLFLLVLFVFSFSSCDKKASKVETQEVDWDRVEENTLSLAYYYGDLDRVKADWFPVQIDTVVKFQDNCFVNYKYPAFELGRRDKGIDNVFELSCISTKESFCGDTNTIILTIPNGIDSGATSVLVDFVSFGGCEVYVSDSYTAEAFIEGSISSFDVNSPLCVKLALENNDYIKLVFKTKSEGSVFYSVNYGQQP